MIYASDYGLSEQVKQDANYHIYEAFTKARGNAPTEFPPVKWVQGTSINLLRQELPIEQ